MATGQVTRAAWFEVKRCTRHEEKAVRWAQAYLTSATRRMLRRLHKPPDVSQVHDLSSVSFYEVHHAPASFGLLCQTLWRALASSTAHSCLCRTLAQLLQKIFDPKSRFSVSRGLAGWAHRHDGALSR